MLFWSRSCDKFVCIFLFSCFCQSIINGSKLWFLGENPLCQWPGDKNYPAGNLGQISAGTGDEELVSGESTGDFQLKWGGSGDTPNLSGDYSGEDTILCGEAASKSLGTGEQFLSGRDERGVVFTHRGRHRGRLSGSLTQGVIDNCLLVFHTNLLAVDVLSF